MCEQTEHTVQDSNGQATSVRVSHTCSQAVQYEFYIPDSIWNAAPTSMFIQRLLSVESGATIFTGLTGVWRGDQEETRIYRMVLRAGRFDRENARGAFRNEIGRLMAELSVTANAQEAVLFTETEIVMHLSSIATA